VRACSAPLPPSCRYISLSLLPGPNHVLYCIVQVSEITEISSESCGSVTIDYRCEDGRSLSSASCVTISNPNSLSSSEPGVIPRKEADKKNHLFDWDRCQKAIGGIYFIKKWRAEILQPGLKFDDFKPRVKRCIFKCMSWLNDSFFGDDDRAFLKEGVKVYILASMASLTHQCFFHLHICGVWVLHYNLYLHSSLACFVWLFLWPRTADPFIVLVSWSITHVCSCMSHLRTCGRVPRRVHCCWSKIRGLLLPWHVDTSNSRYSFLSSHFMTILKTIVSFQKCR
jgi:hypothetical protein